MVSVCVGVCACIWSRVKCPISVTFSGWTVVFTARCAHFMSPKVNCAIYSAWLVYAWVCVLAYDLGSNAQFRWVFPGESCYLQLGVCIYASQSELRHLQCMVSVCVSVHTTVCVCVSHICFKYMAALSLKMAAPPAVALVQYLVRIQRKRKQSLFTKTSDAIRGRAICQK